MEKGYAKILRLELHDSTGISEKLAVLPVLLQF